MRIALMTLPDEGGAAARLGGRPLAWHQLQAALAAGCERIACLAHSPGMELAALQHETERRGASFHAVSNARTLSGLVHAADTLLVFAPGVLPDREWLIQALGGRTGIAILPAEHAVARRYERIDRERAWAGVLATRGDAVEALAALPPDSDPSAGLLRIALQRGVRAMEVPESWLDDGRWALLSGDAAANRFEPLWYAQKVPAPGLSRPSDALSYRLARSLASRSDVGSGLQLALGIGETSLAIGAGTIGYFGHTVAGLALLATGILTGGVGNVLDRFGRAGSGSEPRRWIADTRDAIADAALVAIASSPSEFAGWPTPFAALVLAATMRLARQSDASRYERPLGDRPLAVALLALFATVGQFGPGMAALALLSLGIRLFANHARG